MNLRLSPLFSNGMVLQRNAQVTIRGYAEPAVKVLITFIGEEYTCFAESDGLWSVFINGLSPGGPHTMEIRTDDDTITIKDILIGDVWLCGGQSNMEMCMNRAKYMYPEHMQNANNPFIRQFAVPQVYDFNETKDELSGGCWEALSAKSISDFSAVGYFFANLLYERYRVPIGLITAAVGGTPIHSWMAKDMLEAFPEALAESDKYSDDDYVDKLIKEETDRSNTYYTLLDRSDLGLNERWQNTEYDDTGWSERELISPWNDELEVPGVVWFRKDIDIPSYLAGKPAMLFLGTIIDADTVYLNGVEIGRTTYRYPPREYAIHALPQGRCTIAIRVVNLYGSGGFTQGKQRLIICQGRCIDLNGVWKYRRANTMKPHIPETRIVTKPTGLYNGMIAPLHKWAIKGVIWYQGESDTQDPNRYCEKFKAMVSGWRSKWGANFPFLFVQLTHYGLTYGVDWDLLRKQQLMSLEMANTGMVFTEDVGDHNDLHPMNKKDIGERLARVAMRLAYGEVMPESPFEVCGLI